MAGEFSFSPPFSISHPDKKVSPPAAAVYDGKIFISYIREEGDVYVTTLSMDGKTLIVPVNPVRSPHTENTNRTNQPDTSNIETSNGVKVNEKTAPANGIHQSPGMAVGPKGEIYLTWTSPREGGDFAADIRFARSLDGGKTFLPSTAVNDNVLPSSRGFESISVGKDGIIAIAWLDGREKLVPAGIKQGKKGVSSAYFARSTDGGKTFEKNMRLDDNVCPCCRTAVTAGPGGVVYASWRKVFDGDIRDMVVAGSVDNGKTFNEPVVVSRDQWAIQGCPHRGPSMNIDENGVLYYTWYTEGSDGLPAVYLSVSRDRGKTFIFKQSLPSGGRFFPDHPRLAVAKDGTVYVVWEEKTPVLTRILFASYQDGKGFSKPMQLNQGVRRSHEPILLAGDDGSVYAVWAYDEIRFSKVVIRAMKP
ncbi:MAG: exo-alpha-sialidase [Deltaproteobacteria bacterium]|nr:exo-alpha-sialidase [Deltaproteobacteria bacterium]